MALPLASTPQVSERYHVNRGKCFKQKRWIITVHCHLNGGKCFKQEGCTITEQLYQSPGEMQLPGSKMECYNRRRMTFFSTSSLLVAMNIMNILHEEAKAVDFTEMPALRGKDYGKSKMRYSDYIETESGLQYKDLRDGIGPSPKLGEIVTVDWDGYTIGYYGRIFEARNKAKGGSFEGNEKGYLKFKLGGKEVIPAFEEAVATMSIGGVRRIIVPPNLGYPDNDLSKMGPKPTTFSGQRALDFVLKNQGLIDKTLLFDIELLKIYPN